MSTFEKKPQASPDNTGTGDVNGPATNSADYLPQWDGADSKKLKNGLAVPAGGLAGLTALGAKADIDSPNFTTDIYSPLVLAGATAASADWPTAKVVGSQADSAHSYTGNIGIVGESVASATDTGTGVGGVSVTNGANESRGVTGVGKVGETGDTAKANGVYGYVNGIHAGGDNIGVRGSAINGANNYSFYGENGKIYSSGDIELGHLTDTTIHRVSAGVVSVEGKTLLNTDNIEDSIVDGHTTIAPSGNAVFDALAGKQSSLTFGIADTNKVQINAADVADNDYAKFTATGLEGRSYSEVKQDLALEGTELKSTGEAGGTKFLREDGDGTCSWQAVAGGTDEKVKYDADDPTAGYVADKIVAGTGISVVEGSGATENKLVVSSAISAASTSAAGLEPQATAPAAGLYNYLGITNGETAYTNKALFDATSPSTQAFGDAAATGSAAVSARRDHKHAMPANPVSGTINEIAYLASASTVGSLAVATYPSLTELARVKGVTSAIQTQLNAKGVGDMLLGTAQSVTETKTFTKDKLKVKGTSTGTTNITTANTSATDYTATLPAKDGTVAMTSDIPTVPTKATGAELDTATDDDKFATAKALKDSHNVPSVAPGTSGNVLTSNGTDWTSAAPSGGGNRLLYFDTTQRSLTSITESSLSSYTLTGGIMASGKGVKIRAVYGISGSPTDAVKGIINFGTTTLCSKNIPTTMTDGPCIIEFYVMNRASNDQISTGSALLYKSSSPYHDNTYYKIDSTENTAADVVIDFRGDCNNGNDTVYLESATVELVS